MRAETLRFSTIGIDIGGTRIKMAAFSPEGEILERWEEETGDRVSGDDAPAFAETIRRMVQEAVTPEASVGIVAPGLVARDGRSIAFQPGKMHGIEGFDWTKFLDWPRLIPILNDAHAALLGEVWQGAAKHCRDAVLLTLGTGVGGAVLSDGRLLKGSIGRAGHLGHVAIEESEELSIFGMPGSLENAIGNHTVGRRTGGRFSSTTELVAAHRLGDPEASQVWLKSVRTLARAVASFINAFDPEIVIIGGGIAKAGHALFDPLSEYLEKIEWRPGGHRVPIVSAALGEWAGTYGAAWASLGPSRGTP